MEAQQEPGEGQPGQQAGPKEPGKPKAVYDPGHPEAGSSGYIPPPEHRFKPGQSGNPSGRPKGTPSIMARVRRLMDADPDDWDRAEKLDKTGAMRLARAYLARATEKSDAAAKDLIDRIDGPVAQVMEHQGGLRVVIEADDTAEPPQRPDEIEP
jgi:hypothetical protein